MPIPPDGWGAVESLIWDYALELEKLGHTGTIINTPDLEEILLYLKEDQYDFVHLHYDVFHPIMDRISKETNIAKLAMSSHYPYIDQSHMHRRDGYDKTFDWIIKNTKHYIFCVSKKDYEAFKNAGADESKLILCENGANHKNFAYNKEALKPNRSLYLGKIDDRKMQFMYQSIDSIDFVGPIENYNNFDMNKNYLGEWTKKQVYNNITEYANMVLLSVGENGTPLVIKEGMISGLGAVVSEYAAHDLPKGLPYVTVIPDDKLNDISFVEEMIKENREISISMRDDIRKFAVNNFSWERLVKIYVKNIENLNAN